MARYPLAVWRPLTARTFRSMPRPVRINLHTAVSNGSSLHSMFNRGGVASHFYVRKDGIVEQYVDTAQRAACDLDGNADTISIETWDGYPHGWATSSSVPPWTPQQVSGIVGLLQWIWRTHQTIPRKLATDNRKSGTTSHGLSWHRLGVPGYAKYDRPAGLLYSSSRGKVCPGDRRIAQIPGIFRDATSGSASAGVGATPSAPSPAAPKPTDPLEEFFMSEAALAKLDYISEQIKVTDQNGVTSRNYLQAQIKAVAEGSFGRDAINARNADTAAIVERAVTAALAQVPGVDHQVLAKTVQEAVTKALSDRESTVDVDAVLDGIAKRMEA